MMDLHVPLIPSFANGMVESGILHQRVCLSVSVVHLVVSILTSREVLDLVDLPNYFKPTGLHIILQVSTIKGYWQLPFILC